MKETTRITTIEITDILKGEVERSAEQEKVLFENLLGARDDLHITVQDFELDTGK